ncbi:transcriptional regulator [Brachybacterium sp. EE-P12]|uniref:Transcriptional regulator n=1 Tax=Candidatus Brachybacterium intestinipullorum TaxID=2838512 RepID=A0A9D2PXT8_9MICO|nr:transcriptional regulator [Brachybacterium sp. EE-P12]HJC68228.1 transcriptional regulator [Candidatus Brachybacterium intestinipullorum]
MTVTDRSPTDSDYQARVRRAHAELRASPSPEIAPWPVRAPVLDSWRRSLAAAPVGARSARAVLEGDELDRARRAHPFSAMLPLLRSRLIEPAVEAGLVVALGDAAGRLLWVEGRSSVTARADEMGFAEGADWSEPAMGTSAPALALTTGTPFQVVGAEHFHEAVHAWSCSAVPVLDPRTGRAVGVLDVTGSADAVAPLVLPLLEATSRAVQDELRGQLPEPRRSPGSPAELLLTGRRTPLLRCGDHEIELGRRHAELLTLLHLASEGIRGAELAEELHGSASAEGTVRAEVVRLRRVLSRAGGPEIASRPYRLLGEVDSDLRRTRAALSRADLDAALTHWRGELLPESEAPAIRHLRARTGEHLRELVLERGTATQLWAYAQLPATADDLEVLMAILQVAAPDAPERAAAAARARELRGEAG